jgi:predicted Zn-dependent protease
MNQDQLYEQALVSFRRGHIDTCIDKCKQLLANEPNEAHYHGLLALCLLAKKRLYAAEYEIQLALNSNPEIPFLYNTLARIYLLKNKSQKAIAYCDESLRLDPHYTDSILLKSDIYLLNNQHKQALQLIHDAAKIDADNIDVELAYGEYYYQTGNNEKALFYAQNIMARDPLNIDCNLLMGHLKLKSGDVQEALNLAKSAIINNPDSTKALNLFCDIKVRQNWFLGLWWRFNSQITSLNNTKATMVLISMYLVFNLISLVMGDLGLPVLSKIFSYGWLTLVLYSWVGVPMYQRKLAKELQQFKFNDDF